MTMDIDMEERIREVWGEPSKAPPVCEYAERFGQWTETLCSTLEKRPDINAVYQAKILLVDRFFSWRTSVPKPHRYRMSETGHKCLWHVFEEAYNRIRV